jgi:hypothetical protein
LTLLLEIEGKGWLAEPLSPHGFTHKGSNGRGMRAPADRYQIDLTPDFRIG